MTDETRPPPDLEQPPRGYTTQDVQSLAEEQPPRRRRRWRLWLIGLLILPVALLALWTFVALHWAYSDGERVGYVQKFSRKGWLCKTWEGELAMVSIPGTQADIFRFTVREDSVARHINANPGKRVALHYEQHIGLPTSCFGETPYFVKGVRVAAGP